MKGYKYKEVVFAGTRKDKLKTLNDEGQHGWQAVHINESPIPGGSTGDVMGIVTMMKEVQNA